MIRAALLCLWALPAAAQDIYVLGELHDNPEHHLEQARRVAVIEPAALVFEMLTPEQAAAAEGIDPLDRQALEEALGWNGSGWPDFAMYHPVFASAPEAVIYGAAVPRELLSSAMESGAEAVVGRPGLLPPVSDEERAERIALQGRVHCGALPDEMLPGMVEAQRVRDAGFAHVALKAFEETGGPVVVITGNGHARTDWGVPASIRGARPDVEVFALGQFEGAAEQDAPYDEVVIAAPVARGDPCAAFR
ncbi:ChaN family lipoprotein [Histidinibacterium lentulum]|uniref:Haem-binding uptake Tiki superfamily ChaN domain-containing protein n=1 Tax=Histidinibacterium lentulum TaxID=2480588 RepID=A0A3N2R0N2_9RHOB|nr:ChaN family lipoprotein [Histidinibacterium lentulum]ROU01029.1 hypothetical protein EAT49_10870 [Histidinibacterium lentulum]